MYIRKLKSQIIASFFSIIFIIAVLIAVLGFHVIQKEIIQRAQNELTNNINVARAIYQNQINDIETALAVATSARELGSIKQKLRLDYIHEVSNADRLKVKSEIAQTAFEGKSTGGARIIGTDELESFSNGLAQNVRVFIKDTPKTRPTQKQELDNALAIEYAIPVFDEDKNVKAVRYAGKIINKDFKLVDKIRDLVFANELYDNKPVGTVTIFQDDVRVTTNVLDKDGKRAIGTRVSQAVYDKVLLDGNRWLDKAFVVTDWYLTAYDPIKNIHGNEIGILYVGILEKPFIDLKTRIFLAFVAIVLLSAALAFILAYFLASSISRPVTDMLKATDKISEGDLAYRVKTETPIEEFTHLTDSFNMMADKLNEREKSINSSKAQVEVLNKRYLDLVGFVSHELKGILSSIVLNTYSLKQEILGPINDAQKKTLSSIARNLDYLTQTVKNFLSLSRIEKGEMALSRSKILLKESVFDPAIEAFIQQAVERNIKVSNNMESGVKIDADAGLMQIVANNLISNAVKYTMPGGRVILSSKKQEDILEFEIYNDGSPIPVVDLDKLFRKFSRLVYEGTEKVKGTGIGLFITKEIIQAHGGSIWVEPKEKGNSFKLRIKRVK